MNRRNYLKPATLTLACLFTFSAALPARAAEITVQPNGALPATVNDGDTITLLGDTALMTAAYAAINGKNLTIRSDDPSAWRTIAAASTANFTMFTLAASATETFDNIILRARSTANNADGATITTTSGGLTTINGNFIIDGSIMTARATTGGGAGINGAGSFALTGAVTFSNNSVAGWGAAILAKAAYSIAGSSTFMNNSAATAIASTNGGGGAIYMQVGVTGTFDATNGDITFIGNTVNNGADRNAITIAANASSALVFNTGIGASSHNIQFYDPIASTTSQQNTAINVTQTGDGTLLFDTHASIFSAVTTINSGTFKLTRGAIYGANNTTGSLTLAPAATLAGNGAIRTGAITLAAGSTLEALDGGALILDATTRNYTAGSYKLAGSGTIIAGAALAASTITIGNAPPAARSAQTLTLDPTTPLTLENNATINIAFYGATTSDLLVLNGGLTLAGAATLNFIGTLSGTYTILNSANPISALDFTTLINGSAPAGRFNATLANSAANEIQAIIGATNLNTLWTGAAPGALWKNASSTDANWHSGGATPDLTFVNGDRVTFDDTAHTKTINIDPLGVTIADMTVHNTTGNDYTFAGAGAITSSTTSTSGNTVTTPTGKLVKTGDGALHFTNTAPNTFAAGIDHGGGLITFTNANQLSTGAATAITFTASATLAPAANNLTLPNNLAIAPDTTATIDTGALTLTLAGQLTAPATTSTLAKTGAGTLTLTANNSTTAAATAIRQGTLNLATGAQLGGAINIAPNATLAAAGAQTNARVTASAGSTLQIGPLGAPGPQTLTLDTLALNPGATIRFDLFAAGASDQLNATTLTGASPATIIDINSGFTGTFTLGNLTALSPAQVTIDGVAQAPNSRSVATLTAPGSTLILTVGSDMSRAMYWTGSTDATWNNTSIDWTDHGAKNIFATGDRVIFDGAADTANPARRAITIQPAGVTVSDITIQGSASYTLAGPGAITADPASLITGTLAAATGKLTKTGPGTLALENATGTSNNFKGGIDHAGGLITFTNGAQLATAATAAITFTASATLAPAANNLTLATNLHIAPAALAEINTGANTLTLTGALTSAPGTDATLAKTGTGTLTLSNASAASYTGRIALDAGTLLLAGNTTLGGTLNAAAGSTFGGNGAASTVNALEGSTIQVNPGLLTIAALNLNNGSTLAGTGTLAGAAAILGNVTATIPAGNLTLAAATTGTGNLVKTGAGNLIYSGAPSLAFTGATTINAGYVLLRDIAAAPASISATFVLNGGWLDLSDSPFDSTGATAGNWASLAITPGANAATGGVIGRNDQLTLGAGNIAYTIGGTTSAQQGLFVVINSGTGVTTLAAPNNYAGYTRIDSGILNVTADNQLGNTTARREVILNGGALQISGTLMTQRNIELRADGLITTSTTTLWNAITSTGAAACTLTKSGAGTFNLSGANAASALNVNAGAFAAQNPAGAGKGTVTVASGAHFVFYGATATGTVSNRFTGPGTLAAASSANITLTGTNDIAAIQVSSTATLTAATPGAISDTATVTINTAGRLNLAAPATTLATVNLATGGILAFAPGADYKHATIRQLTSTGTNTLAFNTNIAAAKGDKLATTTPLTGDYIIDINNTGGTPADATITLDLITAPLNTARYTLAGGKVDAGMLTYTLQPGGTANNFTLSLVNTPGQTSNTGRIIRGMAGSLALDWSSELDSVNKRMGELRMEKDTAINDISTWMRACARRFNLNDNPTGAPFHNTQYGVDIGADYKARGTDSNLYLGALLGYGQSTRNFAAAGTARSDSAYAGLYATLHTPAGWYADATLKGNSYKNRLDAINPTGAPVTARYNTNAVGISLEGGKHIHITRGWFIEPQAQAEYATLSGSTYATSNQIDVRLTRTQTTQTRAGLLLGRTLSNARGEYLQAHIKTHAARQWTVGGDIYAAGSKYATKIEGTRIEAGAGLSWTMAKATQIYTDYECAWAADYTKPFSLTLGLRHTW